MEEGQVSIVFGFFGVLQLGLFCFYLFVILGFCLIGLELNKGFYFFFFCYSQENIDVVRFFVLYVKIFRFRVGLIKIIQKGRIDFFLFQVFVVGLLQGNYWGDNDDYYGKYVLRVFLVC